MSIQQRLSFPLQAQGASWGCGELLGTFGICLNPIWDSLMPLCFANFMIRASHKTWLVTFGLSTAFNYCFVL